MANYAPTLMVVLLDYDVLSMSKEKQSISQSQRPTFLWMWVISNMSNYVLSIYLRVIVSFLQRWKCNKYVGMGVQQAVASDYEHSVAFFLTVFFLGGRL